MSRRPPDLPPGQQGPPSSPPGNEGRRSGPSWPRWIPWVVIAVIAGAFALSTLYSDGEDRESIDYSQLIADVREGRVEKVEITSSSGRINGAYDDSTEFTTLGPADQVPERDLELFEEQGVDVEFKEESSNFLADLLPLLIPIGLLIILFIWLNRRAQGQMAGLMNIGRSRAKVYTTEKPKTLFADVAGYRGVKEEIAEVVDFLKKPAMFTEIGARTPKGVLLVGPPGTGKTLIARAVAGEAGVPFISVTGSDFMEMFVGVGAARVRDMFQTARKQAPAIIFVDEIDSIGRKRGAGLGGGHDEREQTLNQMLAEMDGFETVEGVVMMAATNRPDILDPALLRPGRFDRQIMVPLPTQEERMDILKVHLKGKKMDGDVDPSIIARGTPGMSGADLANLVNEAALFAVRRGSKTVCAEDFDAARDRVLMGLKRDSMALSEEEKEVVAYHEGGHAVLAYVLEHADPVHKVTILPTGMALGVTHQL
ncbi:MAG: ATP-dependent zinc metalloprotease FtsH, partial [Candidatus Rokuibacteriota bacterium]